MFDNRWDNWVGDFAESFAASTFHPPTRDRITEILHQFGEFARQVDPDFPDRVGPGTFGAIFRSHLPRLALGVSVRDDVPEVIARCFEYLQESGRLGEGHAWAEEVRSLKIPAKPEESPRPPAKKSEPIRKANSIPVGRNDPCPCGSGKKYKKCCLA